MIDSEGAPSPAAHSSNSASDRLRQGLASLWRKNEVVFQERLEAIRRGYEVPASQVPTSYSASSNPLDGQISSAEEARMAARDAAHKLAGVLGTFDLGRGTDLAREAEIMLDSKPMDAVNIARLASLHADLAAMIAAKSEQLKQV